MLFTALRAPSRCGVTPHILPGLPVPEIPRPPSMSQALAEKWNWLGADYESDPFGSLLLERGRAKKRPEARHGARRTLQPRRDLRFYREMEEKPGGRKPSCPTWESSATWCRM